MKRYRDRLRIAGPFLLSFFARGSHNTHCTFVPSTYNNKGVSEMGSGDEFARSAKKAIKDEFNGLVGLLFCIALLMMMKSRVDGNRLIIQM